MITIRLNHLLLCFYHLLPYSNKFSKISFIVFSFSKQLLQLLGNNLRSLYLRVIQILESLLLVAIQVDGLDFKALNVPLYTPKCSLDLLNCFFISMVSFAFHQLNNVWYLQSLPSPIIINTILPLSLVLFTLNQGSHEVLHLIYLPLIQ